MLHQNFDNVCKLLNLSAGPQSGENCYKTEKNKADRLTIELTNVNAHHGQLRIRCDPRPTELVASIPSTSI